MSVPLPFVDDPATAMAFMGIYAGTAIISLVILGVAILLRGGE